MTTAPDPASGPHGVQPRLAHDDADDSPDGGGPRIDNPRAAALDAAISILTTEGWDAVTQARVAKQAGVGRATVYPHWPRPEQLMLDTMAGVELPFFRDPVSPVRPWMRAQLRTFADEIVLPAVAGVALAR